ncbi:MAG: hypothetical protein AAGJ97_07310 [Planctomycetota bacterium]
MNDGKAKIIRDGEVVRLPAVAAHAEADQLEERAREIAKETAREFLEEYPEGIDRLEIMRRIDVATDAFEGSVLSPVLAVGMNLLNAFIARELIDAEAGREETE